MPNYITATPILEYTDERIPVIPVMSTDTEKFFAQGGNIEYTKHSLGVSYQTGPLAMGLAIDLMSLSQAKDLVNKRFLDVASTIDPDATISSVYVEIGGSVLRYVVKDWLNAKGQPQLIGDSRGLNFLLSSDRFLLTADSLDIHGRPPSWARQLNLANAEINLRVSLSGILKTARGTVEFSTAVAEVDNVHLQDSLDDNRLKPVMASLFEDIKIVGVDLEAYFTK